MLTKEFLYVVSRNTQYDKEGIGRKISFTQFQMD